MPKLNDGDLVRFFKLPDPEKYGYPRLSFLSWTDAIQDHINNGLIFEVQVGQIIDGVTLVRLKEDPSWWFPVDCLELVFTK